MRAPKPTKMHNLELWHKLNGKYIHQKNLVINKPYAICKGQKTKYEVGKKHFEYLKITLCER